MESHQHLSIIHSFHDGMKASIHVRGNISDSFEVCNGVQQECTIAPMLFNLYFCTSFLYSHGHRLVGDCTALSHLEPSSITESRR